MPIIITLNGYHDEKYEKEVSLLKVFDMQDGNSSGQIEALTLRINSLSDFIQNFIESIPEGRKYLIDYLKNSYINGIDLDYKETTVTYKEETNE